MHFSNLQNKLTAVWVVLLLFISVVTGLAWLNKDIHIQANIFALLPETSQQANLQATQNYMSDQLNQKVFVVLDAKTPQQLDLGTQQLKSDVAKTDLLYPLKSQFDADQFGKVLFEYRAGLITPQDQQVLKDHDYEALSEQSLLQMMSPGMPITANLLKQDPLLLFPRYVMGFAQLQAQTNVQLEQGFATIHDEKSHSRLIVLDLKNSPYNIEYQEKVMAWIDQAKKNIAKDQAQSHWTGTLIFSSFGTQSAKDEISTIGFGSSLGLVFLVWFGFRSLRPMLTEFIAVSSGSIVAFAITHLIFHEIHMITLVFGASLIGVCVDFSFYFMALQSQHRKHDGFTILKPLLPSLFMGLMTTIVAYFALSFSPFPGFRQIAVFSMVGLAAAWITSILLLPRLPALNAQPALKRLAFIGQVRDGFQQKTVLRYSSIVVILALGVWGIFHIQVNDDVRNLQSMDKHLKAEDQYVRERFAQPQSTDYLVVQGQDFEKQEQNIISQLSVLKAQGKIQNFQALGQWLPSLQQQQTNKNSLMAIPETALKQYAIALDMPTNDVLAWQKSLTHMPLLTVQDFKQHPLAFLQATPQTRLVLLQGIKDIGAVEALQSSNVQLQQPIQTMSNMFKEHRQQATLLLLYALVALAIGLGFIYGFRSVIPLVLPVTMALLTTFAIQAVLGVEINLFSLMGTFLIIGIGVDYAIFYRHGHDHAKVVGMALFLCMLSTLLGFGLLSFSHTYAIHCFGLTVLLGVIFSFIYATLFTVSDHKHQVLKHLD